MKKNAQNIVVIIFTVVSTMVFNVQLSAQVKISSTPSIANPDAMLEIEATNKGLLLPRLALVSTTSPAPLNNFVKGMLVYDTVTVNNVSPGMYYSDGTQWIKLNQASGTSSVNNWSLIGNSATNTATNFIGTTDNKDVVFKTNSFERVRITKDGWVGIGTALPQAAMEIKGQLIIDTLQVGNIFTDNILVTDAAGRVKSVSAQNFTPTVQKKFYLVNINGQTNFTTPATISDPDKISLYRNGVIISFNVLNSNTIVSEIACTRFDEIRIVQIL